MLLEDCLVRTLVMNESTPLHEVSTIKPTLGREPVKVSKKPETSEF